MNHFGGTGNWQFLTMIVYEAMDGRHCGGVGREEEESLTRRLPPGARYPCCATGVAII